MLTLSWHKLEDMDVSHAVKQKLESSDLRHVPSLTPSFRVLCVYLFNCKTNKNWKE